MLDNFWTLENTVGNLWKESRRNEDVSDLAPLQVTESDSVKAQLNEYESLSSQISS